MNTRTLQWLAAILCLWATLSIGDTASDENKTINVPKLERSIEFDGRLLDKAWSEAAIYTVNEEVAGGKSTGKQLPPGYGTTVRIWRNANSLYMGFRCENPDVPMFLNVQERRRDGAPFSDECVEIFVNTPVGERPSRQFVFNALGSMYDGTWCTGSPSKEWDGTWQVATSIVRGAWYAEVKIPLSDFGDPDYIMINCCRASYAGNGTRYHSAWKAPGWFKPVFRIDLRK